MWAVSLGRKGAATSAHENCDSLPNFCLSRKYSLSVSAGVSAGPGPGTHERLLLEVLALAVGLDDEALQVQRGVCGLAGWVGTTFGVDAEDFQVVARDEELQVALFEVVLVDEREGPWKVAGGVGLLSGVGLERFWLHAVY